MNFKDSENTLLYNPRINEVEKNTLYELKNEFEKNYGAKNYFLIPSSGSAKKLNESAKLIALSKQAVLNSAIRFNHFFQADEKKQWGLVLPQFHVGGLGVLARAYMAGARVFESEWVINEISSWLHNNQIHFLSLVPTQVYDLVSHQISVTPSINKVFVGGSSLDPVLKEKAIKLGWPLIETYGMTETASMIAVKDREEFLILPDVQCETSNQFLKIKCNSLMTASVQKINNHISISKLSSDGWLTTEDIADIFQKNNQNFIKFYGRNSDFIKINGEGISLAKLKEIFNQLRLNQDIHLSQVELLAVEQDRSGFQICLAVENVVSKQLIKTLVHQFNEKVMPFERIKMIKYINQIPRTDVGKVSFELLKNELQKVMGIEV